METYLEASTDLYWLVVQKKCSISPGKVKNKKWLKPPSYLVYLFLQVTLDFKRVFVDWKTLEVQPSW